MSIFSALPKKIGQDTRIYIADAFVSGSEIASILARYDTGTGNGGIDWDSSIAGRSAELPISADPLLSSLAARIEAVLGFGSRLADPTFRFRRYAHGDFHPAHVDCYEIAGQHLVATALIYLTDAHEGGETVFPDAADGRVEIAARAGRLALWFNYTPDGAIDRRSLHRSEELRGGEKATLAYFVYAPLACAAAEPDAVPIAAPQLLEALCA